MTQQSAVMTLRTKGCTQQQCSGAVVVAVVVMIVGEVVIVMVVGCTVIVVVVVCIPVVAAIVVPMYVQPTVTRSNTDRQQRQNEATDKQCTCEQCNGGTKARPALPCELGAQN